MHLSVDLLVYISAPSLAAAPPIVAYPSSLGATPSRLAPFSTLEFQFFCARVLSVTARKGGVCAQGQGESGFRGIIRFCLRRFRLIPLIRRAHRISWKWRFL